MKLIITLIFWFSFFSAIGQSEKGFFEYPKEFKKVENFNLLSLSDTFDCFERSLILSNDSNFRTINTDLKSYHVYKDSGRYSLLSQNILLLQTFTTQDTMDVLTFQGQILLVSRNCKQAVITKYQETKARYKKSKKKYRKQSFKHLSLNLLYFDSYIFHRRNEYTKLLLKYSDIKK